MNPLNLPNMMKKKYTVFRSMQTISDIISAKLKKYINNDS